MQEIFDQAERTASVMCYFSFKLKESCPYYDDKTIQKFVYNKILNLTSNEINLIFNLINKK